MIYGIAAKTKIVQLRLHPTKFFHNYLVQI